MSKNDKETRATRYSRYSCFFIVLGFLVSVYSYYVEIMMEKHGSDYTPLCDVNEIVTCSRPLQSSFATGLGIIGTILGKDSIFNQKNALLGAISYVIVLPVHMISGKNVANVVFWISVFMNLLSIYLFITLVYLKAVCLVCFCIYFINAFILFFNTRRRQVYFGLDVKKQR
ncbi:hypothetical protein AB6A40_004017 [Gnathostoma spinigerum]|uniref:vitamin-K-epoxide reductase (warfarin-sensitive) n=1 Tax=Gnathostoma spinigerum TaxID=75299 RepID=A0ABD6EK11_9BILA